MKNTNDEARMAFQLWEMMEDLGSVLWQIYSKQFMDIMDEVDTEKIGNDMDDADPFPF
jgi:hypothetical protein